MRITPPLAAYTLSSKVSSGGFNLAALHRSSRGIAIACQSPESAGPSSVLPEVGAALLVTGTAIGGGFLSLPYTTSPSGALPSAVLLFICWAFLLLETLVVADLVTDNNESTGKLTSFASLWESAFGELGGRILSAVFIVLMMTTLVSQISRAGSLISSGLGLPYAVQCVWLSAALWAFTERSPPSLLSSANSVLTLGFVLALGSLCAVGLPLAVAERLTRADWSACGRAAPSLLQLLVFTEVVPTVCALLQNNRRSIRRALLMGSLLLLALQLGWSCLGIALAPFGGPRDPLDVLLSAGGPVAAATVALGACATLTTVIGTNAALRAFWSDACGTRRAELCTPAFALTALAPALLAAASKDAIFRALDFAGAYPVAILWGVAPPVMALRLRRRDAQPRSRRRAVAEIGLGALCLAFAAFVGWNAWGDLCLLFFGSGASPRWS